MASRWIHLILLAMITVVLLFHSWLPKDIGRLKNLNLTDAPGSMKSRPTFVFGGPSDESCEPLEAFGENSAFYLPSRHHVLRFQTPISAKTENTIDDQDFCPPPGPGRRSTAILIPIDGGVEDWETYESRDRTTFLKKDGGVPRAERSEIGFLPFNPQGAEEQRLARPPRLRVNMTDKSACPVYYVPASALLGEIPAPKQKPKTFFQPLLTARKHLGTLQSTIKKYNLFWTRCSEAGFSHEDVEQWKRRGYPEFMFGFATTPSRALSFIPRWSEWLPSSIPSVGDQSGRRWQTSGPLPLRRLTANAIVLIPPKQELDQAWEVESVARGAGLDLKLKEYVAERYERRYMSLAQEMWNESQARERLGAPVAQWFALADDDTYFLSLDAVARILNKYDPQEPHFIGGSSESQGARNAFGNIAFGGAGIFLSRGLLKLMNEPGAFQSCVSLFEKEFGGDGMITKCAAMIMRKDVQQVVTKEPTLHQMDIRDEGHGIFQAGWRFTSIHHWNSWFQLQPRAHPHTIKDPGTLASLLGSTARAVGTENWTRRYVWGMSADKPNSEKKPSVIVSLGYSITVVGSGLLQPNDLDKVENTFAQNNLAYSTRPALLETKQRRTYYLYDLQTGFTRPNELNRHPDVAVLSHINQEGEVIDLVWDARPRNHRNERRI